VDNIMLRAAWSGVTAPRWHTARSQRVSCLPEFCLPVSCPPV